MHYLWLLASNFLVISHAIPSSVYLALAALRYLKVKALARDVHLYNSNASEFLQKIDNQFAVKDADHSLYAATTTFQSDIVENLGNMDLLLTDKTGTLTQKNMRMSDLLYKGKATKIQYINRLSAHDR